jgi:hypothetical protein
MTAAGIVWSPVPRTRSLIVLDAERRLYAGISKDETYYHVIQPDQVSGQLVCTCKAETFRLRCYRVSQAEQLEGARSPRIALEQTGIAWFDAPAGAGEEVEAYRG